MDAWNVEELMRRMQQEKERKRGQDFTVLLQSAADTAVHSPFLFSLSPYASVLGYGPRSAWVFYLSCSTAPMRGVHDFVSRKTGCVYREMNEVSPQGAESQEFLPPGSTANNLQNYAHKYSHISSLKILRNTHLSIACQDFKEHLHTWCFWIKRKELKI